MWTRLAFIYNFIVFFVYFYVHFNWNNILANTFSYFIQTFSKHITRFIL